MNLLQGWIQRVCTGMVTSPFPQWSLATLVPHSPSCMGPRWIPGHTVGTAAGDFFKSPKQVRVSPTSTLNTASHLPSAHVRADRWDRSSAMVFVKIPSFEGFISDASSPGCPLMSSVVLCSLVRVLVSSLVHWGLPKQVCAAVCFWLKSLSSFCMALQYSCCWCCLILHQSAHKGKGTV